MRIEWHRLTRGSSFTPAPCFHSGQYRVGPRLHVDHGPQAANVGPSIRHCCVDDPVVRLAWWHSWFDELPLIRRRVQTVDTDWLITELARTIAVPSAVDEMIVRRVTAEPLTGATPRHRAGQYHLRLEAARHEARFALDPAYRAEWIAAHEAAIRAENERRAAAALLRANPAQWKQLLQLEYGYTLDDLRRAQRRLARDWHPDLGHIGVMMRAINDIATKLADALGEPNADVHADVPR